MQDFNLHMHTKRCGHARGEDEEYVLRAIESGFKYIGFSDYLPYFDWYRPSHRMHVDEMEDYLSSVESLRKKYKDQIEILIGFEFEYFDDLLPYYQEIASRVDYMVLGQHSKNRDDYEYDQQCRDEDLLVYRKQVLEAIDAGLVDYMAHVDYFMLGREEISSLCKEVVKDIAWACKENDIPMELNLKGISYGLKDYSYGKRYIYPHKELWDIIDEIKPKIVLGYDAHYPDMLLKRELEEEAREFLSNYDLTLIDSYKDLKIRGRN